MDTLDANLVLGHPEDARDYSDAIEILRDLGIQERKIQLLTNNPLKLQALKEHIEYIERVPLIDDTLINGSAHQTKQTYIQCKIERMNHCFP